ncbi:MAG: nitrate reductase, partial [Actinomycetota bacterium]|nr:nitrate reductase [Actinomycetota bacterium]
LGGITLVLYGMIGLLGAKIWKENNVNFANPVNLVPLAAGIILAVGNVNLQITDDFSLQGIALGTIVAVAGWHIARVVAPQEMRDALRTEAGYAGGTGPAVGHAGVHQETGDVDLRKPDDSRP